MRRFGNGARSAIIIAAVMLLITSAWAGKPGADRVLQLIPADALFCLRVNNLEQTLTEATNFMTGIAPEDFDAKRMVMGKLPDMLGEERMDQIRKRGDFAIYGVILPGGQNQGPMGGLFMGIVAAVKDYDAFLGEDKADAEGIATLTIDGQPRAIATRFGRYALLGWPHTRGQVAQIKQIVGNKQGGLRGALSAGERTLSAQSPIWLYGNVQKAAAIVKPMVFGKLEQIKGELQKAAETQESPIVNPEGIIRFYAGMLDIFTSETASIAVRLAPTAESCTMSLAFKAVPGTEMEAMMAPASEPSNYKRTLPYLKDGAIINVAAAVDPETWEKSYHRWIELIPALMGGDTSQADLDQLKALTSESFRAMGDAVSFSFQPGSGEGGPFSMHYIIEVTDGAAIEKAIAKELELTNSEVFKGMFKNFGFSMSAKMLPSPATYKGVKINAAQVTFEMGEDDSPQSQMIQQVWGGEGLQYRWAVVNDKCVYTIGPSAESDARKLIDQIKKGPATSVCSEMKTAMAAMPKDAQVEAVGTFNYVRILNAFVGGMALPDGKTLPELNVPTESNISFAAGTAQKVPMVWVTLPKQHLAEIVTAFQTLEEKTK